MYCDQGALQILKECFKRQPCRHVFAPNQHIIPPIPAVIGQDLSRDFAQPPFCPVACDRITDLLGTGKTDPDTRRLPLDPLTRLQMDTGRTKTLRF